MELAASTPKGMLQRGLCMVITHHPATEKNTEESLIPGKWLMEILTGEAGCYGRARLGLSAGALLVRLPA